MIRDKEEGRMEKRDRMIDEDRSSLSLSLSP